MRSTEKSSPDHWIDWKVWLLLALISLPVTRAAWQWWNRPPVISVQHFTQLQLLRTAVSSRDLALVDKITAYIESLHTAGTVTDTEWQALSGIVEQARAGEWTAADHAAFDLEAAQQNRWRRADEILVQTDQHDHAGHHSHAAVSTLATPQMLAGRPPLQQAHGTSGHHPSSKSVSLGTSSLSRSASTAHSGSALTASTRNGSARRPVRLPHPGIAVQP